MTCDVCDEETEKLTRMRPDPHHPAFTQDVCLACAMVYAIRDSATP